MDENSYRNYIKLAACICAQDGVISEVEERTMFRVVNEYFPEVDEKKFEDEIQEFFQSDSQIEDYLSLIEDEDARRFALKLSEISAGADGLDTRENIALKKARAIWGANTDA